MGKTWTIKAVKELAAVEIASLRREIENLKGSLAGAQAASDRAILKAATDTEKRFEGVNEFRKTLSDQATTFMPRAESDSRMTALENRINASTQQQERSEGQYGGRSQGWSQLSQALPWLIAAAALLWTMFHK